MIQKLNLTWKSGGKGQTTNEAIFVMGLYYPLSAGLLRHSHTKHVPTLTTYSKDSRQVFSHFNNYIA